MDPWLEDPAIWPDMHASLIIYIRDALQPLLCPHYVAAVEERVYVTRACREVVADMAVREQSATPHISGTAVLQAAGEVAEADEPIVLEFIDQEVHEPYIRILDRRQNTEIVTVIEVLSPSDKRGGEGREAYLSKQAEVLRSTTNLLEIDLLRGGQYTLGVPEHQIQEVGAYDYLVAITRGQDRHRRSFAYPRFVRQRLPRVAVPLRLGDAALSLDLQSLFDRAYEAGDYPGRVDYSKPCIPRLRPDDEAWAQERISAWRAANQS